MTRDDARLELLVRLKRAGYRFVAVTPATHAQVIARAQSGPPGLREVFGWNRPFALADLAPGWAELMDRAGILVPAEGGWRSGLRVASLGDDLVLHSAFPTEAADAVFFGPDSYRFARFVAAHLPDGFSGRLSDMGAGSGAGAIAALRAAPRARVTLVDINPAALDLARINARAARLEMAFVEGAALPGEADVVIANPPYMMDDAARAYRDGGGLMGGAVALAWAEDALASLASGGTLLLYTGAAFVAGAAPLADALAEVCRRARASLTIDELDPDVFGDELARERYATVERIAALGVVIRTAA